MCHIGISKISCTLIILISNLCSLLRQSQRTWHWKLLIGRMLHGFARSILGGYFCIIGLCEASSFLTPLDLHQKMQPASSSARDTWRCHCFFWEQVICCSELLTQFSFHSCCQWNLQCANRLDKDPSRKTICSWTERGTGAHLFFFHWDTTSISQQKVIICTLLKWALQSPARYP